ncbi:tetratricopeptide repeat protein [Flavobacterium silvaticum]|uniref:Tetratricopeptide repeat protein n=1 Tax=Flavobacterium silvaticum TaxID=1852020 RepID=A0A972JKQ6_9FLAO|nr:tetratricopeptide repeat protein [Flavobacterium silvaticum]NMH29367.1 tetratricopeptide repeat protein [Flavobacterium silvaticum]
MATYNKRGYKAPKPEVEKTDDDVFIEDVNIDDKDSTTAGVFNSLDETASKTEDWVLRNQKAIFGIVGAIALATVGYLMYGKFISEPKEDKASEDMFAAQQNFQKALDGQKADSLFTLSLKGSEGKFGFVDIADKYSGTDAGNLANYYAGIAYLNTGKYDDAIKYLDKFKSKDQFLPVFALGAKGDAYSQKNQQKEALDLYLEASNTNKNDFTTPMYLLKAAKVAIALNKKEDALKYLNDIKDNYPSSNEASNLDAWFGLAQ